MYCYGVSGICALGVVFAPIAPYKYELPLTEYTFEIQQDKTMSPKKEDTLRRSVTELPFI